KTVPVLVAGDTVLTDSTDIVAWCDAHQPGTLVPDDPAHRDEALALEDDFDRQLGPATRRWGYAQLIDEPRVVPYLGSRVPRWQALGLRVARPLAMRTIKRGLNVTPDGIARSLVKIEDAFARVGARLADGRRYLVGDRFTVADLTFAALAAPVLLPDQLDVGLPPRDLFGAANAQIDAWRATPAGAFALRMYSEER
ncbi:MAG TPA: glutathione S-transferase C-terminal domain-containing protein, partial [Kofleriaceae bacterium]|nr:glutathione S-transferase C-terminal domain-containing protein [Kofleriaceae bacterium]